MLNYLDSMIAFSVVFLLLSLLITVTTQLVGNVINLRGKNLAWGLKKLFGQIQPSDKKSIDGVVKWLLTHPLIARSTYRKATVIRIEEIKDLLKNYRMYPDHNAGLTDEQTKWIESFTTNNSPSSAENRTLVPDEDQLKKRLDETYATIVGQIADALNVLPDYLQTKVNSRLDSTYNRLKGQIEATRSKLAELELWFDRTADRLSERFTVYSQIISIVASIFLAGYLQLNAIDLFEKVLSDAQLRARWVSSADVVLEQSDEILNRKSTFDIALDSLDAQMNHQILSDKNRPHFVNRTSVEKWLSTRFSQPTSNAYMAGYEQQLQRVTKDRIGELSRNANDLIGQLNDLKITIMPQDSSPTYNIFCWCGRKVLGVGLSIVLLSLGAPFWFNVLKNLASLRTKIVRKEEEEREERQKI